MKRGKNCKGLSVVVGYILLVVFVIIISAIVFQWLKTYIPAQSLECPDGVSVIINEADFNEESRTLSLTLTNNGRFNISGYFINIKNNPQQEIPTTNIANSLNEEESNARIYRDSAVLFSSAPEFENRFGQGESTTHFFNIQNNIGTPLSLRIIPLRVQEYNEKIKIVSCGSAVSEKEIFIQEREEGEEENLRRREEG